MWGVLELFLGFVWILWVLEFSIAALLMLAWVLDICGTTCLLFWLALTWILVYDVWGNFVLCLCVFLDVIYFDLWFGFIFTIVCLIL